MPVADNQHTNIDSAGLGAALYRAFFAHAHEGMLLLGAGDRILHANPAAYRLLKRSNDELYGMPVRNIVEGDSDIRVQGAADTPRTLQLVRGDGSRFHATLNCVPFGDGAGRAYTAVFIRDLSELRAREALLWQRENYDTLTGLPNRHLFRDRLDAEVAHAKRSGKSLALLFIDLDRFKEINESHGHRIGDQLLQAAAKRMEQRVRESDTVARLCSDEFVLILPEVGDGSHLDRIAQDLIRELGAPYQFDDDMQVYISACIGIALYPRDAQDAETLLQQTDCALQVSKAEGRGHFNYANSAMQSEVRRKIALAHDLRCALARHELQVFYQPIVDVASGRIEKAEALLRWEHPQLGFVSPVDFIPLAEDAGIIGEIGNWVFSQALADIKRWRADTGRPVQVGINKSPAQFESHGSNWPALLAQSGLPGSCISIEITEGLLVKNSPRVHQHLLDFSAAGIDVSLDDFGTGYSSLSYLNQFHIDHLKIDRSFVSTVNSDANSRALTEAIIVMAQKLGINAIAEGVETVEQRDTLVALGCTCQQGFLFAHPVCAREFGAMLALH